MVRARGSWTVRRLTVWLVLGAAAMGALWLLRGSSASGSASEPDVAAKDDAPRPPGGPAVAPGPAEVVPDEDPDGVATRTGEPRPRNVLVDRRSFRQMWARFRSEAPSPVTTEGQRSWARERMQRHGVTPRAFELQCSEHVCRAELAFESVRQARRLARIRLPAALSRRWSPLLSAQDGSVALVVYWGVGGTELERWMADGH